MEQELGLDTRGVDVGGYLRQPLGPAELGQERALASAENITRLSARSACSSPMNPASRSNLRSRLGWTPVSRDAIGSSGPVVHQPTVPGTPYPSRWAGMLRRHPEPGREAVPCPACLGCRRTKHGGCRGRLASSVGRPRDVAANEIEDEGPDRVLTGRRHGRTRTGRRS